MQKKEAALSTSFRLVVNLARLVYATEAMEILICTPPPHTNIHTEGGTGVENIVCMQRVQSLASS